MSTEFHTAPNREVPVSVRQPNVCALERCRSGSFLLPHAGLRLTFKDGPHALFYFFRAYS